MRIDEDFDISLNNPDDEKYKFYASKIQSAVSISYFVNKIDLYALFKKYFENNKCKVCNTEFIF